MMGWLVTPERLLKPHRRRVVFLFLGAVAFLVTEFGRRVYRPYVHQHDIADLGIADCIGNLGGIVVQIFLGLAIANATMKQSVRLAVFFSAGYVLYEFAQPVLPRGVFDWKDVYGTLAGLLISLVMLLIVWRLFPETETELRDRA